MILKRIEGRAISHPYAAVNEFSSWRLKDLIRLMDSTDRIYLQKFAKEYFSVTARTKALLIDKLYPKIMSQNAEQLDKYRQYFLQGRELTIIPPEERDYDGILGEVFQHPHFCAAHDFILQNTSSVKRKIGLFTTCAATKPYPYSPNFHRVFQFLETIFGKEQVAECIHWLVISNASAPVPQEYHYSFPFYAYESNVLRFSKKIRLVYEETVIERMNQYFSRYSDYMGFVGLLRPNSQWAQLITKLPMEITLVPKPSTAKKIKEKSLGLWRNHGLTRPIVLEELKYELMKLGLEPKI